MRYLSCKFKGGTAVQPTRRKVTRKMHQLLESPEARFGLSCKMHMRGVHAGTCPLVHFSTFEVLLLRLLLLFICTLLADLLTDAACLHPVGYTHCLAAGSSASCSAIASHQLGKLRTTRAW